jgi:protein SCO1
VRRAQARAVRLAALALALCGAIPAVAAFDEGAAVRASQQAIGREVREVELLTDRRGRLRLSDLRGRPVVISMIYTSCAGICPATTRQLAAALRVARATLGADAFTVLSVGFDTARDTPEALRSFAAAQRAGDPGWLFASGSAADIARLASDTGFWFAPGGAMFEHLIQTTIIDGRGRVVRQLYGNEFSAAELTEPLRKAVLGAPLSPQSLSLIDRIRLLCTVYDARLGRYRADYSLALSLLVALTTLVVVLWIVARAWRSGPRRGAA